MMESRDCDSTNDGRDGGLDPAIDHALVEPHAHSGTYETFNNWFADGERGMGVNIYLMYVRGGFARERATLFLPDGRTFVTMSEGRYTRGEEPGGSSLRLRCIEPFRRWHFAWDAEALTLFEAEEMRGLVTAGPGARISVQLDVETVTEPWVIPLSTGPHSLVGDARVAGNEFLGKYEQIARGRGSVAVDGERRDFSGVGLRAHVRGPREMTGMGSHAWLCGLFPDGRGFGVKQLFDERGRPYFSEAYLSQGNRIRRVRIASVPKISRDPGRRHFTFELDDDGRRVLIAGEEYHSTWIPLGDWGRHAGNAAELAKGVGAFSTGHGLVPSAPKHMVQSCTCYRWDGAVGYGMSEFSG
jgi:hypothetical protein